MYRGGGNGGGGESSSRAFGIDIGLAEEGGEDPRMLGLDRIVIAFLSDGFEVCMYISGSANAERCADA